MTDIVFNSTNGFSFAGINLTYMASTPVSASFHQWAIASGIATAYSAIGDIVFDAMGMGATDDLLTGSVDSVVVTASGGAVSFTNFDAPVLLQDIVLPAAGVDDAREAFFRPLLAGATTFTFSIGAVANSGVGDFILVEAGESLIGAADRFASATISSATPQC